MIEATSKTELTEILRKTDISVPPRGMGRTSDHTEIYTVAYFLSAMLHADKLSYPFLAVKSERPDFILSIDGMKVGVEHTEAVSENQALRDIVGAKGIGPDVKFIRRSFPGERTKKFKEIEEEVKLNVPSGPWIGDSVECEWADAMLHFLIKKVAVKQKSGFSQFSKNWLLIYDNWRLPAIDLHLAAKIFNEKFRLALKGGFDSVYVLSEKNLCEFGEEGFHIYPAFELWK